MDNIQFEFGLLPEEPPPLLLYMPTTEDGGALTIAIRDEAKCSFCNGPAFTQMDAVGWGEGTGEEEWRTAAFRVLCNLFGVLDFYTGIGEEDRKGLSKDVMFCLMCIDHVWEMVKTFVRISGDIVRLQGVVEKLKEAVGKGGQDGGLGQEGPMMSMFKQLMLSKSQFAVQTEESLIPEADPISLNLRMDEDPSPPLLSPISMTAATPVKLLMEEDPSPPFSPISISTEELDEDPSPPFSPLLSSVAARDDEEHPFATGDVLNDSEIYHIEIQVINTNVDPEEAIIAPEPMMMQTFSNQILAEPSTSTFKKAHRHHKQKEEENLGKTRKRKRSSSMITQWDVDRLFEPLKIVTKDRKHVSLQTTRKSEQCTSGDSNQSQQMKKNGIKKNSVKLTSPFELSRDDYSALHWMTKKGIPCTIPVLRLRRMKYAEIEKAVGRSKLEDDADLFVKLSGKKSKCKSKSRPSNKSRSKKQSKKEKKQVPAKGKKTSDSLLPPLLPSVEEEGTDTIEVKKQKHKVCVEARRQPISRSKRNFLFSRLHNRPPAHPNVVTFKTKGSSNEWLSTHSSDSGSSLEPPPLLRMDGPILGTEDQNYPPPLLSPVLI